jgi:esterase/lipase
MSSWQLEGQSPAVLELEGAVGLLVGGAVGAAASVVGAAAGGVISISIIQIHHGKQVVVAATASAAYHGSIIYWNNIDHNYSHYHSTIASANTTARSTQPVPSLLQSIPQLVELQSGVRNKELCVSTVSSTIC